MGTGDTNGQHQAGVIDTQAKFFKWTGSAVAPVFLFDLYS
jgi:hypothetical protein